MAMADSFSDRKRAYEAKWAHDEELRFKVANRRNKLLGLWAAGQIGKSGPDADAYAKSVVIADMKEKGEEDVFRKVRGDLPASVPDALIRTKMDEYMVTAHEQISSEGK
jgi:hypothetical protein